MHLTLLCEKPGAVPLAEPVLWQARRLAAGRNQADEILLNLEIFKIIYWTKHWNFTDIQKGTVLL